MAESAAVAACSTSGGPIAVAACVAAAKIAGDACHRACECGASFFNIET